MIRGRWVWLVAAALGPGLAHAHSDPARFAEPSELGGGGGRYFTGSPQDGLGCSVCHRGGEPPQVTVEGLPAAYEPGSVHEVTLRWDHTRGSHALALELADATGRHAGLELVDADDLPPSTRCDGDPSGAPAAWVVDLEPRRVIGVQDCGAQALSFVLTAPEATELHFSLGVVRSDGSATADGDGVLEIRRVIPRAGRAQTSGCGIMVRPEGTSALVLVLLVLAGRRPPRSSRARSDRRARRVSETPRRTSQ